ncbi:hypothetical protein JJC00_09990 [Bradyrhizobium diazoefficiens]|uniref:hypothetical protein n=1 Tax=Bradyrhizobium diazoefficiens TaxID=1355477 RepID=UPI001909F08C|nr:hypothetical protein [Bradyrhizobium diazoefficiens]QQO35869.1 hypothetical protein JJC00_09990 [Bradyrhizobium diazoefficiens]
MVTHQFRTRNDFIKSQRTRSISDEKAAKSTIATDIPSLITVWLQVRVLPGPPAFARFASFGWASQRRTSKPKRVKAAAPKPEGEGGRWGTHQRRLAALLLKRRSNGAAITLAVAALALNLRARAKRSAGTVSRASLDNLTVAISTTTHRLRLFVRGLHA